MKYELKKIKDKESLEFFRQKSKPVEKINENTRELIDGMFNILYKNNAIGMAAIMAGMPERIVVMELQENNRKKPLVLINPEIMEHSEEIINGDESSISIDNVRESVPRYKKIKIKYTDLEENKKELEAEGLLSICIQHEIDYLDGVLFFDYLSEEKKNKIIKDLTEKFRVLNCIEDIEILRRKCVDVLNIDDNIRNILDKMLATMYETKGIGLAANQVGIREKLVVIDIQENDEKNPYYLINPEIIWKSKELESMEEGCLSVPTARGEVTRSERVKVKYTDKDGNEQIIEANGLFAVCLQHEIDHLNGILYIDHLTKLKRDTILKKVKKELKNNRN